MSDYEAYLASEKWRKRRDKAIARAGGRCQLCNSPMDLNVHHRTYERTEHERLADLTVLCRRCHRHHHRITGGGSALSATRENPALYTRLEEALEAATGPLTLEQLEACVDGGRTRTLRTLRALVWSKRAYQVKRGSWVIRERHAA